MSAIARRWWIGAGVFLLLAWLVGWLAGVIGAHVAGGGMAVLTSHQDVEIPGGTAQMLSLS